MSDDRSYPVRLNVAYPPRVRRWRIFFAGLLALPVFIGVAVMGLISYVCVFLAWIAIIITGRYPRALFAFVEGTIRWGLKVEMYANFMVLKYPWTPAG